MTSNFAAKVAEEGFMDQFGAELFGKLVEATKAANQLPAEDYAFYSTFRPFKTSMQRIGDSMLRVTQRLLTHSNPNRGAVLSLDDPDAESVAGQFDTVVDVLDSLMEKVDVFFDESKGETNKPNIHISAARIAAVGSATGRNMEYAMFHGSNIRRPQLSFSDPVDNSNAHFVHRLLVKPNALVPLIRRLHLLSTRLPKKDFHVYLAAEPPRPLTTLPTAQQSTPLSKDLEKHISRSLGVAISSEASGAGVGAPSVHPYEHEINNFLYSENQMTACKEQQPLTLEATPLTVITTGEQLEQLVAKLETESEIAIDLEQHSYRSFQGFCCLMQVSTRTEDFLIDCLMLRPLMHILNRPFTNPRIVKRDFGLYLVNLFDTGQATRVLEFPSYALAYLLKTYCNVNADKKYQLADWRIRPLPEEMLRYAREDTHYLLYIYDKLKNELVSRGNASNNLSLAVLNRSKALCLRRYEKELFTATSHLALYNKHGLFFNSAQMRVFAALFAWRDRVAREEDESTRYVLPNHMLFHMAELMPTDAPSLLQCCNPIPPLVKQQTADLVLLVQRARDPSDATVSTLEQRPVAPLPSPVPPSAAGAQPSAVTTPTPSSAGPKYAPSPSPPPHALGVAESPVMNEDQLYRTAKWTPGRAKLAAANAGYHSGAAQLSSLLVDSSSSASSDEGDVKARVAQVRAALAADPALPPSLRPISTSVLPLSAPVFVPSRPPPPNPVVKQQPPPVAPAAVAAVAQNEAMGEVEGDEKIPQTLSEIYQLSNKNRKRNKEKKKRKEAEEEQAPPEITSPVQIADESAAIGKEEKDEKRKKHKKAGSKDRDPMEFMRQIGWVSNKPQSGSSAPPAPAAFKIAPPPAEASLVDVTAREGKGGKGKKTNTPAAGRSFSFVPK